MAANGNHSFYKEQEKSILGQNKWTAKRIGRLSWKILKWFLWGFLIIATLWGCVNEFIIRTSNNMGQGVEFYQGNDFVYPNTYQAQSIVGYTATDEEVSEGIKDKDDLADGETPSLPFNIAVVNNEYTGTDDLETEGIDESAYYISAAEAGKAYAYNLNSVTAYLAGLYTYDSTTTIKTGDGAYIVPSVALPTSIAEDANKEIDAATIDKDNSYSVSSSTSYLFYLGDKATGTINGIVEGTELDHLVDWDAEDGKAKNYSNFSSNKKGTFMFSGSVLSSISDWSTVDNLNTTYKDDYDEDKKQEVLNDQIKFAINRDAFVNGTGESNWDSLATTKSANGISVQKEFTNFADANGLETKYVESYTADFTSIKPASAAKVYGGAQTYVIPIQKGFPVRIDEQGQDIIDSTFRKEGFQNWDTNLSSQNRGFDVENQMYGWTVLDANSSTKDNNYMASILRVYDNQTSALENDVYKDLTEENAFYADQRRNGWGIVDEDGVSSSGDYSVFDEKIKTWMNTGVYMNMNSSTVVGSETISYDYATKFAGMTSIKEVTNTESSYIGTLPQVENGIERSILSDSVIPTGQDAWGESRVTFIGWEDWGKAWDVQYGPLYGAFVFPLAQLSMGIGEIFNYIDSAWGVIFSIIVIVFLTRGLGALLSIKGTSNQMKMQEVQTDIAKIKAKYSKYDLKADPRMKQKQQMEIMALYRKKNINPMGSLGTIFITMPIFISLWIIISSLPAYKVVFMGGFSWAVSSWYGVFNMGWLLFLYLMIGISVGLVQGISSKVPTWLSNKRKGIKRIDEATKEAQKKQNKTQNIMIGVFVFMGLTVPALFAFYWICSGFFSIILELIKHAWKVHVAEQTKINPGYITPWEKFTNLFKKKKAN